MRLICFWCFLLGVVKAQNDYYAPQTFRQHVDSYQRGLFSPAGQDGTPQSTSQSWTPTDSKDPWRAPLHTSVKAEPWKLPYSVSKEQQAAILHHKQALTSEGAFRFEYASSNGLAAGEQIEADGSRVGAYQYKEPGGQLVTLKYRAGKDGFQIIEGSHLPKSPEPVAPQNQDNYYKTAYAQQRQQYDLQQQYNQQKAEPGQWRNEQGKEGQKAAGEQHFVQNTNWRPQGDFDDGQYRENEVDNKGPHSFGEGYAFSFKG